MNLGLYFSENLSLKGKLDSVEECAFGIGLLKFKKMNNR